MKHFLMIFLGILLFAAMLTADAPNWEPVPGFQNSMVLISTVNLNSIPLTGEEGNMVGVFGPDGLEDCRGTGAYDYNYNFWYIDIAGTESELLSFKIYSSEYDEIADCNETMPFQIDGIIGSPVEPYTLTSEIVAVDMSLLDIMRANELNTNSDGSIVIDPCAPNQDDILVVVRNWSNYTINDFDVMLTNVINGVPSGGVGTFTYVEHVESIPANGYHNAEFDISGDFVEPTYEYHTGTNPYIVNFKAIVDCNNDIGETNENNNEGISDDSFLLLDNQKPNNYGWCVNDMDGNPNMKIWGTFGEGRFTSPDEYHFHNGIDMGCNNGASVFGISSGEVRSFGTGDLRYVRVIGHNSDTESCKHIYLHTALLQELQQYDFISSGTQISTECADGGHVHFKDMTGINQTMLNPLRTNPVGLINSSESNAPLITEIRCFDGDYEGDYNSGPHLEWTDDFLMSSEFTNNTLDFALCHSLDVIAQADDNLGAIGGVNEYRYGIYKIGYQLFKFDTYTCNWILLEDNLENFTFDDANSINDDYFHYALAIGTTNEDDYHIVTNTEGSSGYQGKIDMSLYNDGMFKITVIAEDIRGNTSDPENIVFNFTGHPTDDDDILIPINKYGLENCYPNPFNPETTIKFSLPENSFDNYIEIYNIKGQLIRKFDVGRNQGINSIVWDGKDIDGNLMPSGCYYYNLKSCGKLIEVRKMSLVK